MRSIHVKIEATLRVAALVVCGSTAACRTDVEPPIGKFRDVPAQRGGILRTAFYADVRSLDAAIAFDTASGAIEGLIYDRLVNYDEQGKLVPELAESIDVSSDGKRYHFTLRRGVLFHDGSELRAADVKRSIERALHSKTPCPVPSFYSRIAGYAEFHAGKLNELSGVRLHGDYAVSFELREADATFLHVMALPIATPLCKSAGRTYSRNFGMKPCGTGPFKLVMFEHGQVARLARHDGYWQKGRPYLDGVEWQLSMQHTTQRFKFERGDLDYMRDFSDSDSLLFRTSAAWQGLGSWDSPLTSSGVFMNTEIPPFDNRHLRRAVAFALNHRELALLRTGHAEAHPRLVPKAILPDWDGMKVQRHDYARALDEMRLAGFAYDPTNQRGGYLKEIPYLALGDSFGQVAAEVYQQQLAKIGIRIRLDLAGWPAFLAKVGRRRTTPMGTAGWSADFPDPSDFFEPLLASSAIQDEESQNHAFFSNTKLDSVLVRARLTADPREREQLFRRAEEIVAEEVPWALGYAYRYFELWQPYVHGYRPHPVMSQYVRGMWFDHGERPSSAALRPLCRALPGLMAQSAPRQRPERRSTLALVRPEAR